MSPHFRGCPCGDCPQFRHLRGPARDWGWSATVIDLMYGWLYSLRPDIEPVPAYFSRRRQ